MLKHNLSLASVAVVAALSLSTSAAAQGGVTAQADQAGVDSASIGDIIVTAQKRRQSMNDVPITITAATDQVLRDRGIASVADLPRLVPGFTVAESGFNSTSFTLRGVGFFNSDLATPPAVSVYVDEAPLPYPAMTKLTAFDLERVEVLKGPQGILYGQNATGGAVNYIAAKPTDTFDAGFDLGYGRFGRVQAGGFISGPLTDTFSARLAVQGRRGGAWQESTTRPGDKLGRIREFQGRASLEWSPADQFRSRLTLTVTHDGSDTLAPQLLKIAPVTPALALPEVFVQPIVLKPRAANWTPGLDYGSKNNLYNVSWRNDFDVADKVTLTSLTTYSHYKMRYSQDTDATPLQLLDVGPVYGKVSSIFQELRLTGETSGLNWVVGANYDHDVISEAQLASFGQNDGCLLFKGLDPNAFCTSDTNYGHYVVDTYGIFGRAEYKLTDTIAVEAGIRYNNDRRNYNGCVYLNSVSQANYFNIFQAVFNGGIPITPLQPGDCQVLDPLNSFKPVKNVNTLLHEDNISWRLGVNWKPQPGTLLYANVSKGYKAGTVPVVGAATTLQYQSVPQESVVAYEGGIKSALFDRHVQLNAAVFYYAYRNKQLRGTETDPFVLSALERLVTIPKSRVVGAEAQVILRPVAGLDIDSSVTYVDSKIDRFVGFDSVGVFGDQKGTPFPFSPKWQSVTDASYRFPISADLTGFLGGTVTYNSKTNSGIGADALTYLNSFTYLDVRGGLETADGRYRLTVWGKNITNKYHWSSVFHSFGTYVRYVASPATFGATLSFRLK